MHNSGDPWTPSVPYTAPDDDSGHQLTVLILAGGRSRRMGQDKLWMTLEGMPLVERVARRVLPVAGEILFSTQGDSQFEALVARLQAEGCPSRIVADRFPGAGPLAGLQAGLAAAQHDLLLALAADMPFVNLALVRAMIGLAEGFDAVVPQMPDPQTGEPGWEPLHALYHRRCLPAITSRLAAGERRVVSFFSEVRVRAVTPDELARSDPSGLSFFNVNTPEDWRRVQVLLAGER
ncbi:MAG: molybdenum cofactor guanylyltransferase [Anaerolineae bacterium]